ncbi:MAG: hypothetical protein IRZ05_20435, partial [Micromonosporaceae bacterium]|nr:hypothetical protein [Micromonosporaceae bacterium]
MRDPNGDGTAAKGGGRRRGRGRSAPAGAADLPGEDMGWLADLRSAKEARVDIGPGDDVDEPAPPPRVSRADDLRPDDLRADDLRAERADAPPARGPAAAPLRDSTPPPGRRRADGPGAQPADRGRWRSPGDAGRAPAHAGAGPDSLRPEPSPLEHGLR